MPELELGPLRFGIVGAGRLGIVIGRALRERGFEVVAATSASPAGRDRAAHALQVPVFDDPVLAADGADVVVVAVPDDAIGEVAARLATRPASATPARLRVVHTSGCAPLAALDALAASGHDTLSVHPLQTVTAQSSPADLVGVAAAVTAHDDAQATFGGAFAHALGMHPFALADEARVLYHAASSFAANFTVTIMAAVRDLARASGLGEQMALNAFAHLAHAAVDRAERDGPEAALTGPIVRGDTGTVQAHLAALEADFPQHARLYRALAGSTVQLAVASGALDVGRAAAVDLALATAGPSSPGSSV